MLCDDEIKVLHEALDDEYKAYATYDGVIEDFGEVTPFTNIREAEGRHIAALLNLYEKYDLPVPDNPWLGRVDHYDSIEAACQAGVEAEIANGSMYDRLIQMTQRDEILNVLNNLQAASQQRHLPAFQRCVERRNAGGRHWRGGGRGRKRPEEY